MKNLGQADWLMLLMLRVDPSILRVDLPMSRDKHTSHTDIMVTKTFKLQFHAILVNWIFPMYV